MKRHSFDLASFLGGLVFLGIGIVYLLSEVADWDVDGRWIVPIALIGLGSAGLAASVTRALRPGEKTAEKPVERSGDDLRSQPGS